MTVLDVHTLLITQVLSYALCTGVMVLLWRQNRRRYAGPGYWLVSFVLQTLGSLLIVLRGVVPDWLSVVAGNALLVAGSLFLYVGLERFVGYRSRQLHNGVLLLVFTLLHAYFTFVQPSLAARNINVSAAASVVCVQIVWLLLRRVGPEMRRITRWLSLLGVACGLISIARILVNVLVSPGGNLLQNSSAFDVWLLLSYTVFLIVVTFSLFLTLNRRLFADVQTQQMALQAGEARYRKLVEFLPDALVVYRDGVIIFANSAAANLLGVATPEQILGKSIFDFLHPDYHELARVRVTNTLLTGEIAPLIEEKLLRADGAVVDVEVTTARIVYEDEAALQTLLRDITARKQAEAALRSSEARWQFALEGAGEGVWDWNLQTNQVYFSPQWKAMLGYAPHEISNVFEEWFKRVHPDDVAGCQRDLEACLSRTTPVYRNEHRLLCKDGTYKWILAQGKIIQWSEEGTPLRMIGTHHDIDERKRAEEALQQSKALLERTVQALEDRERFLAALNEVTYIALETSDLRAMLQVLADRLGELFHADGCYMTLWDEATQSVIPTAAYGHLRDSYPKEEPTVTTLSEPHEWTMTESVLLAGHPLVAEDVFNTPYLSPRIAANYPTRSMIGLPLIAGSRKLGAALIGYNTPHVFSPDEIARAEQTARQISLAVEKSLLLGESQSLWHEAETLRAAALALTSALDHDEVMDRILAQLQQVVPYDTASVQLLREDPDTGKEWLEIVGGRGFTNWEQILGIRFDPHTLDNPNYAVIRSRAPFIVDDGPAVYEGFRQPPHVEAGIRSWLGAPMFVGDRLIGMISLDKTEPGFYTQAHARLAEAFAAQAAIAIENARLYQAQRDHAEQLQAQNLEMRKLTLALEQSGNIIVITDTNGIIQYVNPRFEEVTGYTAGEILGHNYSFLHLGVQDADSYRLLWDTIRSGQIWRGEFRTRRKDGTLYWESATIAPVQDATGQITNYIAIKEDITARKEADEVLRRSAEQLAAQNAELDAFAHTVAHDLREPLGLVIGYARFLEQEFHELSSADLKTSITTMRRYSEKLEVIIKELLLLARIRKEEFTPVPLVMAEIVPEALTRLVLLIQETKARVNLSDLATWPVALGYAPWVEEVWTNYISNALKYGGRPQEGIPPAVELGYTILDVGSPIVDSDASPGMLPSEIEKLNSKLQNLKSKIQNPESQIVFLVRDNGPGLTAEAQAKLFAPFTRLEQVRAQGHGLGLSIVRRIVEKLGGEAGVISAPGEGSCFYFTLPKATMQEAGGKMPKD
ncbi:MAG: PAS domain S-box protein [Anaerolineae bacterium]